MARKKKTDEEPVIAPEVKEEEVVAPAAAAPAELTDTLEALEVEAERNAMPQPEAKVAPLEEAGLAGERPAPKVVTPEEVEAQRRAEGQAFMRDNLETAKVEAEKSFAGEAIDQGTAAVANTPNFEQTKSNYIQDLENKTFAQWAIDRKKADEERLAEEKAEIERERKAARMTGFAELGSALANLFGVAEGNAVSQTHKQYSQDWMRKADADAREHRNRVADLRQRQRDTELKMAQLRQQGVRAAINESRQLEKDRLANELTKARIEYQEAETQAKKDEAAQKYRKVEAEIERLATQMGADLALTKQRLASAAATTKNADTKKGESERKGDQQEKLNDARVGELESRTAKNWSQASGIQAPPPPGWSMMKPGEQPEPAPKKEEIAVDERGLPKHKK